jgi:predicted aconitase
MSKVCDECKRVHKTGIIDCEMSQLEEEKYWEELKKEAEEHKLHCLGCPNPELHVERLRGIRLTLKKNK